MYGMLFQVEEFGNSATLMGLYSSIHMDKAFLSASFS